MSMDERVGLRQLPLATRAFELLHDELGASAWERLQAAREDAQALSEGRRIWFVNSTKQGGGVAEMIRTLVPYWRGSGIDARWLVLQAPPAFFRLTKRIHNLLHGVPVRRLGLGDQALFEQVSRTAGAQALELVGPGDLVILEDPQTAGLTPLLKRAGAVVIWRSHVGADEPSEPVEAAWRFLLSFVENADAFIFSRRAFIPPGVDSRRSIVLAPAIDPFSTKNQPLPPAVAQAILGRCGLIETRKPARPVHIAVPGGRVADIRRRCTVLREDAPPRLDEHRLVIALARWDRLKDPVGIIHGFAEYVHEASARLIVAGPETGAVADDPEGGAVLRDARAAWQRLPRCQRRRIDLASVPLADLDENALIVNALQRQAAVVVKKSLQEGFGLGVTEGMWKARPVVASRVGGHQDQIEHGETGLLVDDPADLSAFGAAVDQLLRNPASALTLAAAGRERVRDRFLADRHFVEWTAALREAASEAAAAA
jgi:trehalose synthase